MPVSQGLARVARIRRRPEFQRAYEIGLRLHGQFMMMFVAPSVSGTCRLGVAATRKLGSAVERNRTKRLSRELFRRHRIDAALDIVIVPRREMLDAPFTSLEAEFVALLDRRHRARPQSNSRPQRRRGRGARAS